MNVLIVCANGMTSSALTQKTRIALKEQGYEDIKVGSCGIPQVQKYAPMSDIILLAPQIGYIQKEIQQIAYCKCVVLPSNIYGETGGETIVNLLLHKDEEIQVSLRTSALEKVSSFFSTNILFTTMQEAFLEIFPITFTGSLLSLLISFPISFLQNTPFYSVVSTGYDMTYGLLSLYIVLFISKQYAEHKKESPAGIMISSVVCFFLLTESIQNKTVNLEYFGSKGIFLGIFTGLFTGWLYIKITSTFQKNLDVQSLRKDIQDALLSIFPVLVCCVLSMLITVTIHAVLHTSLPKYIYALLEKYLDPVLGKNIFSSPLSMFIGSFLWFFGIHGGKVVGTITDPMLYAYSLTNLQAYMAHEPLPYVITKTTSNMYIFGGVGSTLPLAFLMCFFAKSEKIRQLGKISLPMGIFFINEPLIFGLPYVFNLSLILPFLMIPFSSGVLTVFAMYFQWIPRCNGIAIPWTTPPVISGFIEGGWKLALWQVFLLVLQTIAWYPVFKKLDKKESA